MLSLLGMFAAMSLQPFLISSFESADDLNKIVCNNTKIELTRTGATQGSYALKVEFLPSAWPNIYFRIDKAFVQGNWSNFSGLAVDVTNPQNESISLHIRVDDDFSADGIKHCRTGYTSIQPKEKATILMPLKSAIPPGMRGGPPILPDAKMMGVSGPELDWTHIVAFQLFLAQPEKPVTLIFDNIRLIPTTPKSWEKIVDRYGQYTGTNWKGKVHSDADLKKQWEEEEKWLKEHPAPPDRDEYGGWKDGPQLKATGFFRTAYVVNGKEADPPSDLREGKGRWWLVTPSGHLFFSLGIDCVGHWEVSPIKGREYMFSWLPSPSDPLSEFYRDDKINFYAMNLKRKYGDKWQEIWTDITLRRLPSWGFNTIGNWSSSEVFYPRRVPYTVAIHYGGNIKWFLTPDVFDENFPKVVDEAIANATREWKDDPWCLGYFVDNELPWGGWGGDPFSRYELPIKALSNDGTLPAKREFVRVLKEKYGEIENLNKAWNTSFDSWESFLEKPANMPAQLTDACINDLSELLTHFARRYFQVIRDTLKKHAPNQLYLGCRFASRPMEVVRVAAEYCDVVSFNIYSRDVNEQAWAFTNTLGKPCIIGEFHFGALDRGMFHTGLVAVRNQEERGTAYQNYVKSVWKLPAFVGCHWFQYVDEPLTGRFDGENYNIGFLSVVDYPYWELVNAAREINSQVYKVLGGQ
ncbi:beta-galactosidase [bacterium]|nr:beta-galactosidase [bacterium]